MLIDEIYYNHKQRAMIVEDDTASRYSLFQVLKKYDFQVFVTERYEAAIGNFVTLKPGLIFINQALDGLTGLDLAYFIRQLTGGKNAKICLRATQIRSELSMKPNYHCIDELLGPDNLASVHAAIDQYLGKSQTIQYPDSQTGNI